MKKMIYLLTFVIVIGLSQTSAVAAPGDLLQVFHNPEPAKEGMFADRFGSSIAIAGNRILIGATGQGGNLIGAAYLFDLEGNLLHTFESQTQENYGQFGLAVAALEDDILISGSGEVYLFDSNSYSLKHTFTNPTRDKDAFGYTIAALNNKLFISALDFNNGQGRVYIFDANTYQLVHTIENPRPEGDIDQFGFSVAAVGNNIAISSKYHNTDSIKDYGVGAAYLFDVNGTLLATFENPEPNERDQFGSSVASVGGNILVCADIDAAVYLFDANGTLLHTFSNPELDGGGGFGSSVAVMGNKVLIGASYSDAGGENAGAAYLFDADGNLLHTFPNPDPHEYDGFGRCVAMMGNDVLIGAPDYDEPTGERAGIVYLYEGFALGDFEPDGDVDFTDFAFLADYWMDSGLGPYGGADLTGDGAVDMNDLCEFTGNWLEGTQ